jgi:hypothetical protein
MTPHQKAVNAINARLERLQANLREAKVEAAQRFLLQSLVVTVGVAEALNDYITGVGAYVQRRHAEVKHANEALGQQHADVLSSGKQLLEKLKADPTDRVLRQEIERAQRQMTALQKTVRRAANALQRELAPSLAMIDEMAANVRRFGEAEESDALKRGLKTTLALVRHFYSVQPTLPTKGIVDVAAWERRIALEMDGAADFYDAYARAGYEIILALESLRIAVSERPPGTSEEVTQRADEAAAARVKEVTARFAAM